MSCMTGDKPSPAGSGRTPGSLRLSRKAQVSDLNRQVTQVRATDTATMASSG